MKNWLSFSFKQWQKFLPIELLSVLILSLAILVPTWAYIIKNSTSEELLRSIQSAKIAVFLELNTSIPKAKSIVTTIKKYQEVSNVYFVTSAQAMQTFKTQSGFGSGLDFLEKNVLPPTLFVEPIGKGVAVNDLMNKIKKIKQVDLVTLDSYWTLKLSSLLQVLERLFNFMSWCFVLMFTAIVFFITKVLLSTVLNEIKLKLLLGSTHSKIIVYYVIQSIYLGGISAFISLILTWSGVAWLDVPLSSFISEFGIDINLKMLNFVESLTLIAIAVGLYAITAWLTCAVVLHQIDSHLEQADKF